MGKRATIRSGTINLLNTIIGAGMLAMPYGIKCNGLFFGCFLIVWSSLTSSFGLYLQNKVAKYTKHPTAVSYFSLAQMTFPQLSIIFDAAIAIKCFGVGVSYLVVVGDLMPKIMESLGSAPDNLFLKRNFWITIFMVFIVCPFSYLKKLDSLRYISIIALFSVVYLLCLVVSHYFAGDVTYPDKNVQWFEIVDIKSTLSSFPIFVFAYTCHQNMFSIINELRPDENAGSQTRQANIIIRNSLGISCAAYIIVGIFGYLTFGDKVTSNIISMYPKDSISSLIGRSCIVFSVALSYPLQCHPCRSSLNHIIYYVSSGFDKPNKTIASGIESEYESLNEEGNLETQSSNSLISNEDDEPPKPVIVKMSNKKFYILTTVILLSSYLLAISVTSLAHVLAFVGSTGSTSISFILPGLFGYLLIRPLDGSNSLDKMEKFSKYGGLVLAIWGGLVMVVCLTATIFFGATH